MDTWKQRPGVKVKCKTKSQLLSAGSLVHHRTQRMFLLAFPLDSLKLSPYTPQSYSGHT